MTPLRKLILVPIIIILVFVVVLLILRGHSNDLNLSASGTIEAREVDVNPLVSGRVVSLKVEEGDSVREGQILAEIDHSKLDIQLRQAQANLAAAQSRQEQARLVALITKTQTQAQIQQAKAIVAGASSRMSQAQIGSELQQTAIDTQIQQTEAALAQASLRLDQAQEIYTLQQSQSKGQVDQAEAALKIATTRLSIAQTGARKQEISVIQNLVSQANAGFDNAKLNLERMQKLYSDGAISKQQLELVQLQFNVAQAQYNSAQEQLNMIKEGARSEDKEAAQAQVDQASTAFQLAKAAMIQTSIRENDVEVARNAIRQAEAALAMAKANALQGKLRKEDIAAARAGVEQAVAALDAAEANTAQTLIQDQSVTIAQTQVQAAQDMVDLLQSQIKDATITAPVPGTVTEKIVEVGELASPAMPIVVITNLDTVYLTIYISEARLGTVKLGQSAEIRVDSFPDRTFSGKIIYISPEAEFTPKNIQTKEERLKLVYGVKIEIKNPEKLIKPGTPADAILYF